MRKEAIIRNQKSENWRHREALNSMSAIPLKRHFKDRDPNKI
jgi:hypothetical protein